MAKSKIELIVSDHAVIRYIDRVLGFDVEKIREEMKAKAMGAARIGAKSATFGDAVFVLKHHGNICTITTTKLPNMGGNRHTTAKEKKQ